MKSEVREKDEDYQCSLGLHVDYKYITASDLNWIFGIIKRAEREVRLQMIKEKKIDERELPKRLPIVVETIKTGNSIDVSVLLATIVSSMSIVNFGWFVFNVYSYMKKESMDGRYIGRRNNIEKMVVKKVRRSYREGVLIEEVEESFVLESTDSRF